MNESYWLRQGNEPLFPELEWSRPETKTQAGKLLIIGGTEHGFSAPATAYQAGQEAGIGSARIVLPASLRRSVAKLFPEAEFAPSTISGSFGRSALAELCDASLWADGVLFPGEIGRNSETSVLLEDFLAKFSGHATLTKDVADFFCDNPLSILQRSDTLLVIALGQLRRLGTNARFPRAFTSDMDLVRMVDALHEFTKRYSPYIITKHQDKLIVAADGRVSTTRITSNSAVWRIDTAAKAAVWWLQNPTKPFEALTASLFRLI